MIRVSEITTYLRCPRMCYFIAKGHELTNKIKPEHLLLKELALSYASAFNHKDMLTFLKNELIRISKEISFIYREELSDIEDNAIKNSVLEVCTYLENICSNLSDNAHFYSFNVVEVEPLLYSQKFGLSGSPDKVIQTNKELRPSIIKTGNMPEKGVWKSDRLKLTAYALLIEETYNHRVNKGYVEYAKFGDVREVQLHRYERRKILQIRNRIKKIKEGFMPERPKDAPCISCGFTELCDTKSSLMSRFF